MGSNLPPHRASPFLARAKLSNQLSSGGVPRHRARPRALVHKGPHETSSVEGRAVRASGLPSSL